MYAIYFCNCFLCSTVLVLTKLQLHALKYNIGSQNALATLKCNVGTTLKYSVGIEKS